MITFALVAAVLTIGLIFILIGQVYGQSESLDNLVTLKYKLQAQQNSLNELLNYCYEHADRPNPIQDLVDKSLLSSEFNGQTCLSINQMSDKVQNNLTDVENKLTEMNIRANPPPDCKVTKYWWCD